MSSVYITSAPEGAGRENEEEEISGERMSRNGSNIRKTTDKGAIVLLLACAFPDFFFMVEK